MKLCTHSAFSKVGLSCKPSLPFSFKQDDISFEISTPVGKKKKIKNSRKIKTILTHLVLCVLLTSIGGHTAFWLA